MTPAFVRGPMIPRASDAFRVFKPWSMRDRMVRLFYYLCHEAGIIDSIPSVSNVDKPTRTPKPPTKPKESVTRVSPTVSGSSTKQAEPKRETHTETPVEHQPTASIRERFILTLMSKIEEPGPVDPGLLTILREEIAKLEGEVAPSEK